MINLSTLPDPTIIESIDYESLLEEIKSDLISMAPELETALGLESESAVKICELMAYRSIMMMQKANNAALSLMLAKGYGTQLDNLGALPFINTQRKVIQEADESVNPAIEEVLEDDEEYRLRMQFALEGFTTAGSEGAYYYHAISAHEDIKDIAIDSPTFEHVDTSAITGLPDNAIVLVPSYDAGLTLPMPGDVAITALTRINDGTASNEVLTAIDQTLNKEEIRPITDRPRSRSAEIIEFMVDAELYFYPGIDAASVMNEAKNKLASVLDELHKIGYDINLSAIEAALHRVGVQRVALNSPTENLTINERQVAYCTATNIVNAGTAV